MNAPVKTKPSATSAHDAALRDIAARYMAIGKAILDSIDCDHTDRGDLLGTVLDDSDHERARLVTERATAYEFGRVESEDAAERRWNEVNNSGMSR